MAFMRVQKQLSHIRPALRGSPLPLSTFWLSIIRSKSGESFQLLFLCYFHTTNLTPTSLLNPTTRSDIAAFGLERTATPRQMVPRPAPKINLGAYRVYRVHLHVCTKTSRQGFNGI